jgi:monoamine oxidase
MTRKEFIKICGIFGISIPFQTTIMSCNDDVTPIFFGKVLIIGAGVAGLAAGHLLKQKNIDFQILEATANYGGRIKKTTDFADFPIPLGAEWLHVDTNIFKEIINDESVAVNVNTVGYKNSDSYATWENGNLTLDNLGAFEDRKFINGSWFDFFETYIVPSVSSNISYNAVVKSIDYTGDKITVATQTETYTADKVIVTVPLKILQNGAINFIPSLPNAKLNAINNATVWGGLKVFLEFSQKFYPTFTEFKITPETAGQVAYYDAAYGQNTNKNILGLFAVGTPALNYTSLSGDNLKNYILNELDTIFTNQATPNFIKYMVQNWSEEPHIKAAYLSDYEDYRVVATLFEAIDDKIYFAGEAYTSGNDWGGVHAAAQAAKETIEKFA